MIRGGGGSVLDMELTADGRLLALAVGCWLLVAGCINMTSQKLVKDTQSHSQFKNSEKLLKTMKTRLVKLSNIQQAFSDKNFNIIHV